MAKQILNKTLAALFAATLMSVSAAADINPALRSMLETAIKSGDASHISAIKKVAIATWPEEEAAIINLIAQLSELTRTKASETIKTADTTTPAKPADADEINKSEKPSMLVHLIHPSLWNAQVELGGGISSGNIEEKSLAVGVSLKRKFGDKWEHNFDGDFDYAQRQNPTTLERITSKDILIAKYKVEWKPWKSFYTHNTVQYVQNKLSGYSHRILENIGIGYEVIKTKKIILKVDGGPGVRFDKFEDTGLTATEFMGRFSSSLTYNFWKKMSFTNKSSVAFTKSTNTYNNDARLSLRINSSLATRLSHRITHDTNPRPNKKATNTVTRATLVYDF